MSGLKILALANNKISSLPDEITNMTSLYDINLCGNKISEFPAQMEEMNNLMMIGLTGTDVQILNFKIQSEKKVY